MRDSDFVLIQYMKSITWLCRELFPGNKSLQEKHNSKVKNRSYRVGDLVLRKAEFSDAERRNGDLGAIWEDPYKLVMIFTSGTYQLEDLNR